MKENYLTNIGNSFLSGIEGTWAVRLGAGLLKIYQCKMYKAIEICLFMCEFTFMLSLQRAVVVLLDYLYSQTTVVDTTKYV